MKQSFDLGHQLLSKTAAASTPKESRRSKSDDRSKSIEKIEKVISNPVAEPITITQTAPKLPKAIRKVDDQIASFAYLTKAGRNHDK